MQKKKHVKFVCLTLGFILLFSGCAGNSGDSVLIEEQEQGVAMGRYVERELALPGDIRTVRAFHKNQDGTLAVLASDAFDAFTASDQWKMYQSTDMGESWADKTPAGASQLNGLAVLAADFDSKDDLYMVCYDEEQEQDAQTEIIQIKNNGDVSSVLIPEPMITGLRVAESGDFFICTLDGFIEQYSADGAYKRSYTPVTSPDMQIHSFVTWGDTLAVFQGSRLICYDTQTGEQTDAVEVPDSVTEDMIFLPLNTLQYSPENNSYYFCKASGIYRFTVGGGLMEQPVNGNMSAFSMPSMSCEGLLAVDDFYLAYYKDNDRCALLKYVWDNNAPTVPDKELSIYSLYDHKTIRQANSLFQRSHPDTYITYEVGFEEDSAITLNDAIRNLNTRILAGQGPDLIVMDDLPIQSFMDKGILRDLSDLVGDHLMEPMAHTYQLEDGSVYAIPARFGIPVLLAEKDAIASIHDFSDMVNWGLQKKAEYPDPSVRCTTITQSEALLRELFPLCASTWFAPDGSIDKDKLSEFLEGIDKIAKTGEQKEYNPVSNPFPVTGSWWVQGRVLLQLGTLLNPDDIKGQYWAIDERKDGGLVPTPMQGQNVYIPQTILSVANTAENPQLGMDYISFVLSETVQNYNLADGFPVNFAALQYMTSLSFWEGRPPTMENKADGTSVITPWPSEATLTEFRALVSSLDTPAYTGGAAVRGIVLEQANAYFAGSMELRQTVDEIAKKLELYLKE